MGKQLLFVLACLFTGSALLACPARAAEPLLPDGTDWGAPAPGLAPIVLPEFPPLAGWWRYLGQQGAGVLAAGHGRLLLHSGGDLQLCDASSGALLWTLPLLADKAYFLSGWTLDAGHIYYASIYSTQALSAADGAALWSVDNCLPLACAPGGIWLAQNKVRTLEVPDTEEVWLADAATGAVLQRFPVHNCRALVQGNSGEYPVLAAVAGGDVLIMHTSGTMLRAPAASVQGGALVAASAAGVFVAEQIWEDDGPPKALAVSCYDCGTGALRWRNLVTDPEYAHCDVLTANARFCSLETGSRLLLYDAATGELLNTAYANKLNPGESQQVLSGDRSYVYGGDEPNGYWELQLLTSPGRQRVPVFPSSLKKAFCPLVADGYMYEATRNYTSGNASLFAYKLGEDGLPLPGELQLLGLPQTDTAALQAFAASPRPLADEALVRRLVAGGSDLLVRLARQTKAADGAQLDALAALAVYLDGCEPQTIFQKDSASELFVAELRKLAAPELTPTLARWLDDPSLASLQLDCLLALPLCGSAAGPELQRRYAELMPQRYVAPPPPYQGELRQSVLDAYAALYPGSSTGQYHVTACAEAWCDGPDGARYVVYTSPGLLSLADLYIGVDENGDGKLEQVWPSGLRHLSSGVRAQTLEAPPPDDLALSYTGGVLLIHHQEPLLGGPAASSDRQELPSESRDSRLTLDELRQDNDGDGLTDITEAMLFTDPACADSDGDGLSDGEEPAPRVDAAKMNLLERAASRGMNAFFARYLPAQSGFVLKHPREALCFYLSGVGPVAAAPSPGRQGIDVDPALEAAYYARAGAGWASNTLRCRLLAPRGADEVYDKRESFFWPRSKQYCIRIFCGDSFYFVDFRRVGGELYPSAVGYGSGGSWHIPFM